MLNIRIVTAGAILVAMAGAAAAQSDTSAASGREADQESGKPSLLQMLFKPNAPQTPGDAEASGATATSSPKETTATTRIVQRHWHHHRDASRKSHPAQDEETAAAHGSAAQANVAPPADATTAAETPAPAAMTIEAPATASLPDPSATAPAPVEPTAMVVDGQTVQIASQDEINALDLAADSAAADAPSQDTIEQSKPAADTVTAVDTMAAIDSPAADRMPADNQSKDIPVIAFAEQEDGNNSRDIWYEDLLATLGSILAAASAAWFLVGRAPPRRDRRGDQMLVYDIEPMRR